MFNGRIQYIKEWGMLRFLHCYLMLLLKRFLGFRISVVRAQPIVQSRLEKFETNGIEFRELSLSDFSDEAVNRSLDLTRAFVEKNLLQGDQCVGAVKNGQVIGYGWRTVKSIEVDQQVKIQFGDKLYYRYKGYVLPEHRGNGLFNLIKSINEQTLIDNGRTHVFGCIETHNFASLRASLNNGDFTIGYSAYFINRFGLMSWQSRGAKKWGVDVFRD